MTSLIEIEQAAAKLRRYLKLAQRPDLKLICGLRFFDLFRDYQAVSPESYLREFLPMLAEAAGKCNPREFFPEDVLSLARLIELVADQSLAMPVADDLTLLRKLDSALAAGASGSVEIAAEHKNAIRVPCLFVEYYPDLDLPPRGRMLDLYVTASPISTKAETDDIVVRNPVSEPDDRFLAQARDSVTAARKYLTDRYGLSSRKRYRFDFAVDSTGARFTGDSLGAAFAVGAVAAVAQIEVFRERLSISPSAAFSGALTPGGKLNQIDAEALKLKIYRAFHSDLKLLVIPREHITDAWAYLSELETRFPGRKLELVGAESLEAIASDPRLVPPERFSTPAYYGRKAWRAKRSAWVEFPAALALAAILFILIAPPSWMPWFDRNPHYATIDRLKNSLTICNEDSLPIWAAVLPCVWSGPAFGDTTYVKIHDINGDGSNEVCCLLPSDEDCVDRAALLCYSSKGALMFKRQCSIPNEYPGDTAGVQYFAAQLTVLQDADKVILVTAVAQNTPARLHIRLWDEKGNPRGWYVNAGAGDLKLAYDFNRDGSQELFIETFNNRMGCVGLLVVGLDSLYGVSPPYKDPGWDLSWVRRGNQISYILFPVSDLGKACGELVSGYNIPITHGVRIDESDLIKVYTCESNISTQAQLIYSIDRRFRVVKVEMTDQYRTRRQCLVESKILPEMDDEYSQRLADAVTYWTDSGWVTEGQLRAAGR